MMTLAQFLSDTALHTWIVGQAWLWPVLEITHFIGLTLLIGGLLVVDLRVLGVSASTPLAGDVSAAAPCAIGLWAKPH